MRILLIDDCTEIGELISFGLNPLKVEQVFTLAEARAVLARDEFNLVLIDVTLPDGDGFEFCRELSLDPRSKDIPRILLTARQTTSDKVMGFHCGADDYVTKPFAPLELKARIEARLRGKEELTLFRCGSFEFDLEFQRCFIHESGRQRDLQLTATEFRLLLSLVKNEGSLLTREELVRLVWQNAGLHIEARGINSHIRHLRQKLGSSSSSVVSVYGRGYSFKKTA